MITTLAGGVGAARMLAGLLSVHPGEEQTAIVNVADDTILHGLHVSPDLDTVTYTLAGAINPETGWGLVGETWEAMGALERYGGLTWFGLGDKDLATHLYRTHRLNEGTTLTEVTGEIVRAWDLDLTVLPVSDNPIRTMVTLEDGSEIGFQEYFVKHRHDIAITSVRFEGVETAAPGPDVLSALLDASAIVVAPSNPIVSIGPVLAVPGVAEALRSRREKAVAVSPIIGGAALKGPADRMLRELGHESSVVGVARVYADLAATLVIDEADRHLAPEVEAAGMACVVADTIMASPTRSAALARTVLDCVT